MMEFPQLQSQQVPSQQIVYQADPNMVQQLRATRERMQTLFTQYANRPVVVEMMDGQSFEGVIVSTDGRHLYLQLRPNQPQHHHPHPHPHPHHHHHHHHNPPYPQPYQMQNMPRQWFNPLANSYFYNNVILPLVLFELLTIALI